MSFQSTAKGGCSRSLYWQKLYPCGMSWAAQTKRSSVESLLARPQYFGVNQNQAEGIIRPILPILVTLRGWVGGGGGGCY